VKKLTVTIEDLGNGATQINCIADDIDIWELGGVVVYLQEKVRCRMESFVNDEMLRDKEKEH